MAGKRKARAPSRPVQAAVESIPPGRLHRAHVAVVMATLVLAVVGIGVAGYLLIVRVQGSSPVCVATHGCATVQNSVYSKIMGIPVAVPGLGMYVALAAASVAWLRNVRTLRPQITFLAFNGALFGVLFSGYLTYLEAFVIDAWCVYCIVSASLLSLLLLAWVAVLVPTLRARREEGRGKRE